MSQESQKNEITIRELIRSLKRLFRYLWSKWLILLGFGIIGGVLGLVRAYRQQPVYIATLSFALEEDKGSGGLGGALGLASQFGFDLDGSAGGAFNGANLVELMKSRSLLEHTFMDTVTYQGRQTTLADIYIDLNDWRSKWSGKPGLDGIHYLPNADPSKFTRVQDSIMGMMCQRIVKDNLSVGQRDKKVSIIYIDIKSGNELFSKLFTERLAYTTSDFYVTTKSKKAKINVDILMRQTDSVRSELYGAISDAASANDNLYNLNTALSNTKRVPSVKKQVDVTANTGVLTELIKNLELAKMTLLKETPLIQVIDTPKLPLLKERASRTLGLIFGSILGVILSAGFLVGRKLWRENS